MNRTSTLLIAFATLFTVQAHAQFTEDFENPADINSGCWILNETFPTTFNGKNVFATNPITGNVLPIAKTPPLNITSTSLTVSFNYYYNLANPNTRTQKNIQIGLENASGNYIPLDTIITVGGSSNQTTPKLYSQTFTPVPTGLHRLVLTIDGDNGLGLIRTIIDDLSISASGRYSLNGGCNSAPTANNDNFVSPLPTSYTGNVITNTVGGTDTDPDGETLTATLVNAPSASVGKVVLNPNGSFTFTPSAGFTSGTVTFTYRVSDNGYAPLTSNIATVTIVYPAMTILPVKLMSFTGSTASNKAQLKWSVADNETGDHFEVLRSTDGKNYTQAGMVFASGKTGAESYTLTDEADLAPVTYYQLKIVNKDNRIAYSNVIILKTGAAQAGNSLTIQQNPVGSTLNFSYTSTTTSQSKVVIYNAAGVKVFSTTANTQMGTNALSFSLDSRITPGAYILEVSNASERSVAKLIKK